MDADKIAEIINAHRRKISLTLTGAPAPIVIDHEWLAVEEIIAAFADELEAETLECPALGCDSPVGGISTECLSCGNGFSPKFIRAEFETAARGPQPEPESPIVQPAKSGLILPGG